MSTSDTIKKRVRALLAKAKKKLSDDEYKNLKRLTEQLYAFASEDDIASQTDEQHFDGLMSFWKTFTARLPGETKIHVYNPDKGSESTRIHIIQTDMPFLVDTVMIAMGQMHLNIKTLYHCGDLYVKRSKAGKLSQIIKSSDKGAASLVPESVICIEIDYQGPAELKKISKRLSSVLEDVRYTVQDFKDMRSVMPGITKTLAKQKHLDNLEQQESLEFLKWLEHNHFIFLGYAKYQLKGAKGKEKMHMMKDTALGLLRRNPKSAVAELCLNETIARELALSPQPLEILKSTELSTVHRPALIDIIRVKEYDSKGMVAGEHRLLGLYTSSAYHRNPQEIPFLDRKVDSVLERSRIPATGHSGKALRNILETYPRDELFQIDTDTLFDTSMGILRILERHAIKLFARKDVHSRFYFCMVFVPRDLFKTELRLKFQEILTDALGGNRTTFEPNFMESVMCRIDYMIHIDPAHAKKKVNLKAIESKLVQAARDWTDDLSSELKEREGEQEGIPLFNKYKRAFPAGYQEMFLAKEAARDIECIETLTSTRHMGMYFYRRDYYEKSRIRLKVFDTSTPLELTTILPILENMGLRVIHERPYTLTVGDQVVWLSDFGMEVIGDAFDIDAISDIFEEAFKRVCVGEAENDGFNKLVTVAKLSWRQVMVFRAYTKYLMQVGSTYSQHYIEEVLAEFPHLSQLLWKYFDARFCLNGGKDRVKILSKVEHQVIKELDKVTNLDKDRIIRRFLESMKATLRTNFYQKDARGEDKSYISFKLKPELISGMPKPYPMFEIFVYSPRVEGVHLRGAKVARGGLRWSDRPEDFRTEVLGLMKAQQVKNAVIVPLGAKGGFVPKMLPTHLGREAVMEEAIGCYKTFISSLLDLTENVVKGKVVSPKGVVPYDDPDPYLVVAADKGTASFSDIANGVAEQYGFWLGDAFAAGGSNGYDHKKMGITARGAWESVKRHFFTLGHNVQKEPFTVVGIGDMSGDVFGNGMLLSDQIRLVAAFNHLHIFIDPNPSPGPSFKERQRLFQLPRSTWLDYDPKLISKGGGVIDRSAKKVDLSPEIRSLLGIREKSCEPDKLISHILRAKVDLLWNGGIGTYVKSSKENHMDVGDRTNDNLRVDGLELRCRVVGEGGNLGFTQLGRVEFAKRGGLIYTDAIDNSAGVDCSDHEVNIKILLNDVVSKGKLSIKKRNELLASMDDDVAKLVLDNNYHQTQSIDIFLSKGKDSRHFEMRLLQELERDAGLERDLEFLPDDKELATRYTAGHRLTSPEISVLTAYAKTHIKHILMSSDLPDDPYFELFLFKEFPMVLRKKYPNEIRDHQLRREIIVTTLINQLFKHTGIFFVYRLYDETGAHPALIVRAYAALIEILDIDRYWDQIETLDGKVKAKVQSSMMIYLAGLIRRTTRWLLRNQRHNLDVNDIIKRYRKQWQGSMKTLPALLVDGDRRTYNGLIKQFTSESVPKELAEFVALCPFMSPMLDILQASSDFKIALPEMTGVYFELNDALSFAWLRRAISQLSYDHYWGMLASAGLRDDLDKLQRSLTLGVLLSKAKKKGEIPERVNAWLDDHRYLVDRWATLINDLKENKQDFVVYIVAIRGLLDLAQAASQKSEKTCLIV